MLCMAIEPERYRRGVTTRIDAQDESAAFRQKRWLLTMFVRAFFLCLV